MFKQGLVSKKIKGEEKSRCTQELHNKGQKLFSLCHTGKIVVLAFGKNDKFHQYYCNAYPIRARSTVVTISNHLRTNRLDSLIM
jgi:hypothetical protein